MTESRDDAATPGDRPVVGPENTRAEPAVPRPRRSARGAVVIGVRVVTGVVGILVAAVLIGGASILPLPAHTVTAPSMSVTPVATTQQRLCPGPLLQYATGSGAVATRPSSFGPPTVFSLSSAGEVVMSHLATTDNAAKLAPTLLTVPAASDRTKPALFAGSQSQNATAQSATGQNDVGFAASDCVAGSSESWLVGGATTTGRTTLITLSNPTQVPSTVDLTIYSERGQVSAAGADGILVAPGAQRIFSLAGFAPGIASPVVRVESQGGAIVANLQQSIVRTLAPGGVDIVGSSEGPAVDAVVPGVVIAGSAAVLASSAQVGYSDITPVLRLFVPGTTDAVAKVSVVPQDSGANSVSSTQLTLVAGIVTEVPLGSIGDGVYTVRVTATRPVVAGVRTSTIGSSGATDFAWLASAQPISGETALIAAPGPDPHLNIASSSKAATTVTLTAASGTVSPFSIVAGGAVTVPLIPGADYTMSAATGVFASVSYQGDGELAGFTISPPSAVSQPIRVFR